MRSAVKESEQQRRRRVVSRIRGELRIQVADDLAELARVGKLPNEWMTADQVNRLLTQSGYWAAHSHVLAPFLSPGTCEDIVAKALDVLAHMHPDTWVRAGGQYKPTVCDWNAYAVQKANQIRLECPQIERTALHTGADGASILFGHCQPFADRRAAEEVKLLRKYLRESGVPELGFGVSPDGKTWVMVVWSTDEAALSQALLEAWQRAFEAERELNS